jgi:hypothetical protein
MNANGTILVHFMNPRDSRPLDADILPHCTGHEAMQMLKSQESGPFIDPSKNYILVVRRTEKEIGLDMTFADAGVQNNDAIDISPKMTGAGRRQAGTPMGVRRSG